MKSYPSPIQLLLPASDKLLFMTELFAPFHLLLVLILIGLGKNATKNSSRSWTPSDCFHTSLSSNFHFSLTNDSGRILHCLLMAIASLADKFQLISQADGLSYQAMGMKMAVINQELFWYTTGQEMQLDGQVWTQKTRSTELLMTWTYTSTVSESQSFPSLM